MANIVDSLIVSLGLDATEYEKGQKKAGAAWVKAQAEATAAGKNIEKAGRDAADGINALTKRVLELFAVFTAGQSIKSFIADLTTSDAALGRLSRNIDVAPDKLSALGLAVERVGGSYDGAVDSFTKFSDKIENFKIGRDSGALGSLNFLLGTTGRTLDLNASKMENFLRLADSLKDYRARYGAAAARNQAHAAGITDEAEIELLEKGREGVNKAVEEARKYAPGKADTDAAEKLQSSWRTLLQISTEFGREILTKITPVVTALFKVIGDWVDKNKAVLEGVVLNAIRAIGDGLRAIPGLLKAIPWDTIGEGVKTIFEGARFILNDVMKAIGQISQAVNEVIALARNVGGVVGSITGSDGNPDSPYNQFWHPEMKKKRDRERQARKTPTGTPDDWNLEFDALGEWNPDVTEVPPITFTPPPKNKHAAAGNPLFHAASFDSDEGSDGFFGKMRAALQQALEAWWAGLFNKDNALGSGGGSGGGITNASYTTGGGSGSGAGSSSDTPSAASSSRTGANEGGSSGGGGVLNTGSSGPIPSGSYSKKAPYVMGRLMSDPELKFTRESAAAAVGWFAHESGLSPTIVNKGGGDTGWAQWVGSRRKDLYRLAGVPLGQANKLTDEDNYRMLKYELTQGPYKNLLKPLQNAHTLPQAFDIWGKRFEGATGTPAGWDKEAAWHWPHVQRAYNMATVASSAGQRTSDPSSTPLVREGQHSAGIRRLPIKDSLREQLEFAAAKIGANVNVVSGGQAGLGEGGPRTGSTRHDHGGAADLTLTVPDGKGGMRKLDMRNPADAARMASFARESVRVGATGIGAGEGYMGPNTMHIGGGTVASWGGAPWIGNALAAGRADAAKGQQEFAAWKAAQTAGSQARVAAADPRKNSIFSGVKPPSDIRERGLGASIHRFQDSEHPEALKDAASAAAKSFWGIVKKSMATPPPAVAHQIMAHADLGRRIAAASARAGVTNTNNNTSHAATHIGEINIHTAADDAHGIAKSMDRAIKRHSFAQSANYGLA